MVYEMLDRKVVYRGRVISLSVDTVRYQSGNCVQLDVVLHNGGAAVVALTEDLQVALVRQYRHPVAQSLLELPAGRLEEADTPLDGAKRELAEETGLAASDWKLLVKAYPAPGYCQELLHIYLARHLVEVEAQPDCDEEIEVEYLPLDRAVEMCYSGEITDAKTIIGLLSTERLLRRENEGQKLVGR